MNGVVHRFADPQWTSRSPHGCPLLNIAADDMTFKVTTRLPCDFVAANRCHIVKVSLALCPLDLLCLQAYDVLAKKRNAIISVAFKSVSCQYKGGVQVSVLVGTKGFLQVLIQNVAGPGNLRNVEVSSSGGAPWVPMTYNYGQVWQKENFVILNRFLSFRLTAYGGRKLILSRVVPPNFRALRVYNATVNF